MMIVLLLVALLAGGAWAVYRWRKAVLKQHERIVRQQRHLEEQQAWERMMSGMEGRAQPPQAR